MLGFEVKSLRERLGALAGAYAVIRGGEAFVTGMYIPPFQPNNTPKEYDPYRTRKLLLTKRDLLILLGIERQKGLTIVPISIYNKGRKLKVSLAVVKGRKKHDKREVLKKRQSERDIRREYSDR